MKIPFQLPGSAPGSTGSLVGTAWRNWLRRHRRSVRCRRGHQEVQGKRSWSGEGICGRAGLRRFPDRRQRGIGVGAARGKGYVYQRGRLIGRSTLTQVTIGLQLGGQAYSEVVFFKDAAALDSFKRGRLKLDAQASAVALTARASADLAYRNGVAIVTMAKGGLMYEASVGGQKFSYKAIGKTS